MITKNSLSLFWRFQEYDQSGSILSYHDEVDGLIFYGHWHKDLPDGLEGIDEFISIWPAECIETRVTKWDSGYYSCYSIDVRFFKLPDEKVWPSCLQASLEWFVALGALVAWCGGEDCSPSLQVFDIDAHAGNVYACYSRKSGLMCNAGLHEDLKWLDDEQLTAVAAILRNSRHVVTPLAS